MFTGIIEEMGRVVHIDGQRVRFAAKKVLDGTKIGDSIAVNGVCLTVTDCGADFFTADVMPETIRRTSLEHLPKGGAVNLERALLPTTRLGGHIVSGHIDGTGTVADIRAEGNAILLTVMANDKLLRYIAEKGSVALDGISLTVAKVTGKDFTVSLIPQTMRETNLHEKKKGSLINIETDIIAKYTENLLATPPANSEQKITAEFLAANGF